MYIFFWPFKKENCGQMYWNIHTSPKTSFLSMYLDIWWHKSNKKAKCTRICNNHIEVYRKLVPTILVSKVLSICNDLSFYQYLPNLLIQSSIPFILYATFRVFSICYLQLYCKSKQYSDECWRRSYCNTQCWWRNIPSE